MSLFLSLSLSVLYAYIIVIQTFFVAFGYLTKNKKKKTPQKNINFIYSVLVFVVAVNVNPENQTLIVETITMTTVTEHRIIRTAEDSDQPPPKPPKAAVLQPPALPEGRSSITSIYASSQSVENMKNDLNATIIPKFNVNGTAQAITGILKGGKLRKTDSIQVGNREK